MKNSLLVLFLALLSVVAVQQVSADGGGGGYQEEKLPPMPYNYAYAVQDSYSGADYDKKESQDAYGNLRGQYTVQLPDGRRQIVTYTADHNTGFVANVEYVGNPVYPASSSSSGYRSAPSRY